MGKLTKLLKVVTVLLSIALVGLVFLSNKLDKETGDLNDEVVHLTTRTEEVKDPTQPIGVLLLGLDGRDGGFDNSRSDAILVASINPEYETTEIVTIPRDTLVEMNVLGGKLDKINHSYMNGGVDSTIRTVSNYLDFPVHYVVEINMQGLEDLIDSIGGIYLTPTITFSDKGHDYVEGEPTTMNGHKALTYARMRKKDPKGDVGRGERQQEIINALVDKLVSMDAVANYNQILEVVKGNMRTNVPITAGLIKDYIPALTAINKHSATEYNDYTINGVYYLGLHESERLRLSNRLRNNLGLENTGTDKEYILENASVGDLGGYNVFNGSYEQEEEIYTDTNYEYSATTSLEETDPETTYEQEESNTYEGSNGYRDSEDELELFYGESSQ